MNADLRRLLRKGAPTTGEIDAFLHDNDFPLVDESDVVVTIE